MDRQAARHRIVSISSVWLPVTLVLLGYLVSLKSIVHQSRIGHFFHSLILCICLLLGGMASAQTHAEKDDQVTRLARTSGWLKLLHISAEGETSAIHDAGFFLSPQGASDPVTELRATLAGMAEPLATTDQAYSADHHVRCRYPARVRWLEAQLGQTTAFDRAKHCPAYTAWRDANRITTLSLVLATGYLGNPASYYGHVLLKFNTTTQQSADAPATVGKLLDTTVNYGAIETRGDDPLSYIFKGIFGGYDALFSTADFYVHENNYGENELRDLWEYQLELPREDVNFVVDHVWEILERRYTYFFFRHNCAYRMAEVLEVLDGIELNPPRRPYTLPQAVIDQLAQTVYRNRPLVSAVIHHPSRQSRFHQRYARLSAADAEIFKQMARNGFDTHALSFAQRPLRSKQQILDTLMDYYRFSSMTPGKTPSSDKHPEYRQILATRYQLPPDEESSQLSYVATAPHQGRAPSWLQVGVIRSHLHGQSGSLRLRPAYYDALDASAGHVPHARLSMGEVSLYSNAGHLRLEQLDIIAIDSVSPGITGLPADNGEAWKLKAGIEPAHTGCNDCLVPRLQGDLGYGRQFSHQVFLAAYVGGAVQDNRHDAGRAFARLTVEAILHSGPLLAMKLSSEQRLKFGADTRHEHVQSMETRWAISRDMDVRWSYRHGKDRQNRIGLGYYW